MDPLLPVELCPAYPVRGRRRPGRAVGQLSFFIALGGIGDLHRPGGREDKWPLGRCAAGSGWLGWPERSGSKLPSSDPAPLYRGPACTGPFSCSHGREVAAWRPARGRRMV